MLGEAGDNSQEDPRPKTTLGSGSLRKGPEKSQPGATGMGCERSSQVTLRGNLGDPGDSGRWLPLKGLSCQLEQEEARIK